MSLPFDFTDNLLFNNQVALKEMEDNIRESSEKILESNMERKNREVENNANLKVLVKYNYEISNYNRELVSLNEKILNKINSLDDTLMFLNSSFIDKTKMDKEQVIAHNVLLLELITIIDSKDSSKLNQFMTNIGVPVAAGLIVEFFKMKLGLSGM